MKYVIGGMEASKDAPLTVEMSDGRLFHIGTLEGILSLLRHYSTRAEPDEDQGIRDRAESAEAESMALKAALKEAQGRCESLIREHAKYRDGVVAGDKMVSDKRAALEKEIEGMRMELNRTKILLKSKEESLEVSEAEVRSLRDECARSVEVIADLHHRLAAKDAQVAEAQDEMNYAISGSATLNDRVRGIEETLDGIVEFMADVRRAIPWLGAVRQ